MGCCGKKIRKAKNIVKGNLALAIGKKYEYTDSRIRKCQKCKWNTWLSAIEYITWLAKNGIKVLANIEQLEKLPMLPKYEQARTRKRLYCRLCKCYIPAKAPVEDERCLKGKW